VVKKLKKRVGKTWYVFSGSTPAGWDCSGLVMWTYQQIGIKLKHSATEQGHSGHSTKHPKTGDIVAFGWKGTGVKQHVGIYLGNGMMIHSGGAPGERTAIISIAKWAKENGNTKVTYIRLLDTL
jgi:cell wall-associated NlpC family hydrolase